MDGMGIGSGRWEMRDGKWKMGDRKCKMGYGKQNMGGRRWEIGDWRLEIGDLRLEIENGKKLKIGEMKKRWEQKSRHLFLTKYKVSYNKGLETGVPWNTRECK